MKKKPTPFLDFYYNHLESGEIPKPGLCDCRLNKKILGRFIPTDEDEVKLILEDMSVGYWASGLLRCDWRKHTAFTPLRQTIVLFCAAIKGELES